MLARVGWRTLTEDGEGDFLLDFLPSDGGLACVIALVLLAYGFKYQVHSVLLLFHVDPNIIKRKNDWMHPIYYETNSTAAAVAKAIRNASASPIIYICLLSRGGRYVSFAHFGPDDLLSTGSFAGDEVALIGEDGHSRVAGRQPDTRLLSGRQS